MKIKKLPQKKLKLFQKHRIVFNPKIYSIFIGTLAIIILSNITAKAQKSPDFAGFSQSGEIGAGVDKYSGSLIFNIPVASIPGGPDGGGATLSLSWKGVDSYRPGSAVGLGWSGVSVGGAVSRITAGIEDDCKCEVTQIRYASPHKTFTLTNSNGVEVFGIGGSHQSAIIYDSFNGFRLASGAGVKLFGLGLNIGGIGEGDLTFTPTINASGVMNLAHRSPRFQNLNSNQRDVVTAIGSQSRSMLSFTPNWERARYGWKFPEYSTSGTSLSLDINVSAEILPIPVGITGSLGVNYTKHKVDDPAKVFTAYGYMYARDYEYGENSLGDYDLEMDAGFYNQKTTVLPQTIPNPDHFQVNADGLQGTFRFHQKNAGHYFPNEINSSTSKIGLGVGPHIGTDFGGHTTIGFGGAKMKLEAWNNGNVSEYQFSSDNENEDQPVFARFYNDLADNVLFTDELPGNGNMVQAFQAGLKKDGLRNFSPDIPNEISKSVLTDDRVMQSSDIHYYTNGDIESKVLQMDDGVSNFNYLMAAYDPYLEDMVDRSDSEKIGAIEIHKDGLVYLFALPVLERNKKNITVTLSPNDEFEARSLVNADVIDNNGKFRVDAFKNISGTIRKEAVPMTWLLTAIIPETYRDKTGDGLSPDDYGWYVKYTYRELENDEWFHMRSPAYGLHGALNELSHQGDNTGSFSSSDRQMFLLDTIFTKTHKMAFIAEAVETYEAAPDHLADNQNWNNPITDNLDQYERINRIELYVKGGDGDKKVQTTYFEYFEEEERLLQGAPFAPYGERTLKRVFTEQEDVKSAFVNDYEFGYDYQDDTSYPDSIQSRFPEIVNYGNQFIETQNAPYNPHNINEWGTYQSNGFERNDSLQKWTDQNPDPTDDVAMWELKTVKLPSGSEIHIQYEADDYSRVKNKTALTMVSLKSIDGNRYYLDVENDLGLDPTDDFDDYVAILEDVFVDGNVPLFPSQLDGNFVKIDNQNVAGRFLYEVIGDLPATLESCASEYIEFWARVIEVGHDEDGVYLVLADNKRNPQTICQDKIKSELNGKVQTGLLGSCNDAGDLVGLELESESKAEEVMSMAAQLMNKAKIAFTPKNNLCKSVSLNDSYLRVPVLDRKIGGGNRVKRLLRLDRNGLEGNPKMLGEEFFYKKKASNGRIVSTGVAANEFGVLENTLNHLLPEGHEELSKFQDICQDAGFYSGSKDVYQVGGILASLREAPSVGYSHVYSRNINPNYHDRFDKNVYYTAADNHFEVGYTKKTRQKKMLPSAATLNFYYDTKEWVTQGFGVTINNDFAGKLRKSSSNIGDPFDDNEDVELSYKEIKYFNGYLPILNEDGISTTIQRKGVTQDISMFSRHYSNEAWNTATKIDLTLGLYGIFTIPWPTLLLNTDYALEEISQHTTTLITYYPVVPISTTEYSDGIVSKSEYLAFDSKNGNVIKTSVPDEFDGLEKNGTEHNGRTTTQFFPAHEVYPAMSSSSENYLFNLKHLYSSIVLVKSGGDYELHLEEIEGEEMPCEARLSEKVAPGDMLELFMDEDIEVYTVIEQLENAVLKLHRLNFIADVEYNKIPTDSEIDAALIIQSSRNNVFANIGSITTYGEGQPAYNSDNLSEWDDFIGTLDTNAAAVGNYTLTNGDFPNNLEIMNADGSCNTANGFLEINLTVDIEESLVIMDCNATTLSMQIDISVPIGTTFDIDKKTGELIYYLPEVTACPEPIECIKFCYDEDIYKAKDGLLAASASVLSDDHMINSGSGLNPYQTGEKGIWRVKSNWVYSTDEIKDGNNHSAGNFLFNDAGTWSYKAFDHHQLELNELHQWVKSGEIEKYDESGKPMVTRNALGIPSLAKYDYTNDMPQLIATNATDKTVMVESCENMYSTEGVLFSPESWIILHGNLNEINDEYSHTGKQSIKLKMPFSSGYLYPKSDVDVTKQIEDEGFICRMWVRSDYSDLTNKIWLNIPGGLSKPFKALTKGLEWNLVEAVVMSSDLADYNVNVGDPLFQHIEFKNMKEGNVYVDDIMMRNTSSSVKAYIYDKATLRLAAQLNSYNFSIVYEYNAEGDLLRLIQENTTGFHLKQEGFMQYKEELRNE